jgi:hypothetical protein
VVESRGDGGKPPGRFENAATAPRVWGLAASAVVLVAGLVMTWAVASNPIFGLGLDHPASIALGAIVVCIALGSAAYIWVLPDERWRRVPDGPLSPEFRALADAGREREAMNCLRTEHGAGLSEARQVLDQYLAQRPRGPAESGAAADIEGM